MSDAHVVYYKTKDGKWVAIPCSVSNMYDSYLKYCQDNNITTVATEHDYYVAVGNLVNYVAYIGDMLEALSDAESVKTFLDALEGGTLPTALGGTGAAYNSFEELAQAISNKLKISSLSKDVINNQHTLSTLLNKPFAPSQISSGTVEPTEATTGSLYFQYKE